MKKIKPLAAIVAICLVIGSSAFTEITYNVYGYINSQVVGYTYTTITVVDPALVTDEFCDPVQPADHCEVYLYVTHDDNTGWEQINVSETTRTFRIQNSVLAFNPVYILKDEYPWKFEFEQQ